MATETRGSTREVAGKLFLPLAVAVGSALGYLLTKKQDVRSAAPKLREAVSDLPRPHVPDSGVGDLAGKLRDMVGSALGREPSGSSAAQAHPTESQADSGELEQRRRERQERRNRRRQRSRR